MCRWNGDEISNRFRKAWELGRTPILTESVEKEMLCEQRDEVIRLYRKLDIDIDDVMGDSPLYKALTSVKAKN